MANDAVDLEALFGPQTSCACEDCRSIHSPAAYFVDTLMFLGDANRDALFGRSKLSDDARHAHMPRRPDLGEIQLSCANTETVLPYIDLVNEVLEYAVLMPRNPLTAPVGGWPQTTGNADDLAVNPQWIITCNESDPNERAKAELTRRRNLDAIAVLQSQIQETLFDTRLSEARVIALSDASKTYPKSARQRFYFFTR